MVVYVYIFLKVILRVFVSIEKCHLTHLSVKKWAEIEQYLKNNSVWGLSSDSDVFFQGFKSMNLYTFTLESTVHIFFLVFLTGLVHWSTRWLHHQFKSSEMLEVFCEWRAQNPPPSPAVPSAPLSAWESWSISRPLPR